MHLPTKSTESLFFSKTSLFIDHSSTLLFILWSQIEKFYEKFARMNTYMFLHHKVMRFFVGKFLIFYNNFYYNYDNLLFKLLTIIFNAINC